MAKAKKQTTTKATSSAPIASRADAHDSDVLDSIHERLGDMEDKVLEIRDLARVLDLMSGSG